MGELDIECTAEYIEASGNDAIISSRLTPGFYHLISSAFYTGLFEVIIHNMPKLRQQSIFVECGVFTLLDGKQSLAQMQVMTYESVDLP